MNNILLIFALFISFSYKLFVDSCDLFTHIIQDFFTGIGAIMWLSQCQWRNPEGYG